MKRFLACCLLLLTTWVAPTCAAPATSQPPSPSGIPTSTQPAAHDWTFAASGDSRDCGNVVMPAIAAKVRASRAELYWHLGDLRSMREIDADIVHDRSTPPDLSFATYLQLGWDNFIEHQIAPFGDTPFYVGIGNHEVVGGHSRSEFIARFRRWLDSPVLHAQRVPHDAPVTTWYQWVQHGVAFIYLDNASQDEFSTEELAWFAATLKRALERTDVRSIVVGMHEALPFSYSLNHSMNQCGWSTRAGLEVYKRLLEAQQQKHVYVLASHSHYYMANIYNTPYWQQHGGVLPGWIVGTAGAKRIKLPVHYDGASEALEHTYGYLQGTVHPDATIDFRFERIEERDVPPEVVETYGAAFVHEAFTGNAYNSAPKH